MPSYDASRFDPPAPVTVVTLRVDNTGVTVPNVLLLLDSGADVTLLPHAAVDRLGVAALTGQREELVGFDGTRSFAPVVVLDMHFLNRVFRGQYLVTDGQIGILGRDVLNHVAVLLNGPRQEWSEQSQ
jgi:hypothetical protein